MTEATREELRAIALGILRETGGVPVSAPSRRSFIPKDLPAARPLAIYGPSSYGTGTMFRRYLDDIRYVDITAAHVGNHDELLDASDAPGNFVCARLLRPTAMTLPAGMSPSAVDLFDVAILGPAEDIEAFKVSCPALSAAMPRAGAVWPSYGFPFATGFGDNSTGQPRQMQFQTTADGAGSLFFKTDHVAGPGMSGSPLGAGGAAVLTGMAYFDDGSGAGPEHWAVGQVLHNGMELDFI